LDKSSGFAKAQQLQQEIVNFLAACRLPT